MPAINLNHCNFQGPREIIEQLKDFYCQVVGLQVGPRPPVSSFGYWLFAGENPVVHLSEQKPDDHRTPFLNPTFHHLAFTCSALEEMEAALVKHGIVFRRAHVPLSGEIQLFFQDPAGNGVELNFAPT